MSGLSVSVSRPPFWFPVELASNCAQGDVAISSGEFGTLKNKRNNVEFASQVDLYAFWFNGHQVYQPKNPLHYLYFRWRNYMLGWTI